MRVGKMLPLDVVIVSLTVLWGNYTVLVIYLLLVMIRQIRS